MRNNANKCLPLYRPRQECNVSIVNLFRHVVHFWFLLNACCQTCMFSCKCYEWSNDVKMTEYPTSVDCTPLLLITLASPIFLKLLWFWKQAWPHLPTDAKMSSRKYAEEYLNSILKWISSFINRYFGLDFGIPVACLPNIFCCCAKNLFEM